MLREKKNAGVTSFELKRGECGCQVLWVFFLLEGEQTRHSNDQSVQRPLRENVCVIHSAVIILLGCFLW